MRLATALIVALSISAAGSAAAQTASESYSKSLAPAGSRPPRASTMASAPPLTRVSIWAVGSEQYGNWEQGLTNAFITANDHGGGAMSVAVWEVGYANTSSRIAKMNGTQLPNAYLTEALCGTSTTTPQWCNGTGTITGYMVYYDLNGYQAGSFSDVATSLVFPYNQKSASINIK